MGPSLKNAMAGTAGFYKNMRDIPVFRAAEKGVPHFNAEIFQALSMPQRVMWIVLEVSDRRVRTAHGRILYERGFPEVEAKEIATD